MLGQMVRQRGENELRAAFRGLGAVTAANARPGKEFPLVDSAIFDELLRRGVIREGAPGTYYLYEPVPGRGARRLAQQLLFWLAVLAIPVGIMQFCGGPR